MNIQFKKGVRAVRAADAGIRRPLRLRHCQRDFQSISISNGTVYPILRRLKQEEYVSSYLGESLEARPENITPSPSGQAFGRRPENRVAVFSGKVTSLIQMIQKEGGENEHRYQTGVLDRLKASIGTLPVQDQGIFK